MTNTEDFFSVSLCFFFFFFRKKVFQTNIENNSSGKGASTKPKDLNESLAVAII